MAQPCGFEALCIRCILLFLNIAHEKNKISYVIYDIYAYKFCPETDTTDTAPGKACVYAGFERIRFIFNLDTTDTFLDTNSLQMR